MQPPQPPPGACCCARPCCVTIFVYPPTPRRLLSICGPSDPSCACVEPLAAHMRCKAAILHCCMVHCAAAGTRAIITVPCVTLLLPAAATASGAPACNKDAGRLQCPNSSAKVCCPFCKEHGATGKRSPQHRATLHKHKSSVARVQQGQGVPGPSFPAYPPPPPRWSLTLPGCARVPWGAPEGWCQASFDRCAERCTEPRRESEEENTTDPPPVV